MANVFAVSDWFECQARRNYKDCTSSRRKDRKAGVYKKNMANNYNQPSKRDQTVKTTSSGQNYGGVKKVKYHSAFKQPFVYENLIAMAIRSSSIRALNVAEIHAYIAEVYPYFKACPGTLKANIIRTLSSSACFQRLGEPCEHYWTLTSKAKTCVTDEPSNKVQTTGRGVKTTENLPESTYSQSTVSSKNYTPYSQTTDVSSNTLSQTCAKKVGKCLKRTYSQVAVPTTNYTPYSQYNAIHPPNSQPSIHAHWQTSSREAGFTHDELLRRYIHNSPLYPRVPVITPAGQKQPHELGIRIGQVYSLNAKTSTASSCLPVQEPLPTKMIPYHPCTFWVSHGTHHPPNLSSFVSEDKERYEDA